MKLKVRSYDKVFREKGVQVSDEKLLHLYLNDVLIASLLCSPKNLVELGVGFFVTEGVLNFSEISDIKTKGSEVSVKTKNPESIELLLEMRTSGCSGLSRPLPDSVTSKQTFSPRIITNSIKKIENYNGEWRKTGGTHTAMLITSGGRLLRAFEDVGRHNALDKVIGWALLNKKKLDNKFIIFTGRLSSGIVTKTARVDLPLIASNTAPLSRAIKIADRLNITLIGFARGSAFNIYTHDERII